MNEEKAKQQKELDGFIKKSKEIDKVEKQKQKEVLDNWSNLTSDEKILDTLLDIQKTLSTIDKQNNNLESIRREISNRSVQISDKLTSLNWSLTSLKLLLIGIFILIYVFIKFGIIVFK